MLGWCPKSIVEELRMDDLRGLIAKYVDSGALPGAVGLVARGDQVEVAAVGAMDLESRTPMTEDSIFRLASLSKPITAAAVMVLVDDGTLQLDAPVDEWLPELAAPMVVRTPSSPVDDVVPADRPITVFDLLSSQAGYGFASDFDLPVVQALSAVQKDGREPQSFPPTDAWMADLAALPLAYQPGKSWLYDTCSAIQGVLVARASGRSLPDFLAERVFEPLGMRETAFVVPPEKLGRFTSYYRAGEAGLELADAPDGQWSRPPAFPLGSGGLAGTAGDWLRFGQMLLAGGTTLSGRRLLTEESVSRMLTDHTTPAHRKIGELFLDGQGWGFGGSVDITPTDAWTILGRYGWVGGTGTTAHVIPATNTIAILLTQVAADRPTPWLRTFWHYAAPA
jgi:CubicO group peptidase (beta-lactamase class C family)